VHRKHVIYQRWHSVPHILARLGTSATTYDDYKFATHPVSTEHWIFADELSPVRLPLAFVASLIKFHIGVLESVRLFAVCSP
jgi:hypothetical protein